MIKAIKEVSIGVLEKLGQGILNGVGMLSEWKSSVIIPCIQKRGH